MALEFASLSLQGRGGVGRREDIAFGSQYVVAIALYARMLRLKERHIKRQVQMVDKVKREGDIRSTSSSRPGLFPRFFFSSSEARWRASS